MERVRSLEQQVQVMKGHLDVARAKEKTAADGEAFVLETVRNMNKDLESKQLAFLYFVFSSFHLRVF